MISNQVLQNTLEGVKEISGADLLLLTPDGEPVFSTAPDMKCPKAVWTGFVKSEDWFRTEGDLHLARIRDDQELLYILVVGGDVPETVAQMTAMQLESLQTAYKERFDTESFIKNLLLDNLLLVDIYNRARKLRIAPDADRIVFILETPPEREQATVENLKQALGSRGEDFITAIDEKNIILVHEMLPGSKPEDVEAYAKLILKTTGAEDDEEIHVAYGTIVHELKDVSRSYKEARMALDIGKIFFDKRSVIAYSSLGIGRLIYQLPIPLCKIFIKEIFSKKAPDDFDEETLVTINKFFENNLNVSETSRQLFIHRNTLVYRLDKLQKSTGLDLRVFEDAITFKIALMVVKYMKYMETLEY